jgi:hypothetical protein
MSGEQTRPHIGIRNVWMYWETPPGRTKPAYLDLCLETIERRSEELSLRLLNEATVGDFLPDLRPEASRLTLVHRSDYYRSRLVHRYGGIWLDADLIALRPLRELLEGWHDKDVALYGRGESNVSIGCFAGVPGSPLLTEWMKRQDEALDAGGEIPWNGLGKDPLVTASMNHEYHRLPVNRIAPLPWQDWKKLLSRWRSPRRYLRADPIVFMLYNKFLHDAFNGLSASEILESDMLISKLFRFALGETDPTT